MGEAGEGDRVSRSRSLAIGVVFVVVTIVFAPVVAVIGVDLAFSRARSDLLAETERAATDLADEAAPDEARVIAIASSHEVRLVLVESDGHAIMGADRSPEGENALGVTSVSPGAGDRPRDPIDEAEIRAALSEGLFQSCVTLDGGRLLRCRTLVRTNAPDRTVAIAERTAVRSLERLTDVEWPLLMLAALTLVLGAGLAAWLVARLVIPLARLRSAVLARAAGTRAPVPVEGPREIRDVALAFDELLRSLAREKQEREVLVADLAHELKGPLASLRTSVEVFAGEELDVARRVELAAAADRSVRRIDATLFELLELARAEAGLPKDERTPVDVGALARETVGSYRAERAPRVSIELEAAEGLVVNAAAEALSRALRSLLDNACAFAKESVRVSVRGAGSSIALEVADDGEGFDPAELERVFDRFHSRREGGTGLGLALVRAIAVAHGGRAAARNERGGVVRIELPRADSHRIHEASTPR
jgi:signal transduction histidine kinase